MDERELVLTSLIYPLIFREAAQIGIATPIAAHIRELLKIHTPEPEVIRVGNATPVSASVRNIFQNYEHPLQDYAQIGVAKPVGAYFKNLFNEYIHPHSDFAQIGNAIPVSLHQVNLLKNLQTFKTDHVVQVGNAIPEAVYSTCKPVVFAPVNLYGWYDYTSNIFKPTNLIGVWEMDEHGKGVIRLSWTNLSITNSHQNLYKSSTPFTADNLPPIYQQIPRDVYTFTDEDVTEGTTYYYAVSTEAGLVQLVSDVTEVVTVGVPDACDPHWDKVVSLLHFDGDLTDVADIDRTWSGSYVESPHPGIGGSLALDKSARIYVPDSYNNLPTPWVFYKEEATLEFFLQRDSAVDNGNVISLWPSNIRFRCEIVSSKLVFTAFIGSTRTMSFNLPFIDSEFEHIALVRNASGRFNVFRRGNMLPEQYGPYSGIMYNGTGGHVTAGGVTFDELRITKGVARYTENFTPPTKPFPNFGCS